MRSGLKGTWWKIAALLLAQPASGETLEERSWTVVSKQFVSPFQLNPAALATKDTVVSFFQLTQNSESKYIFNPDNNPSPGHHKVAVKDIALGGQYPLGGASVGLHIDQYRRSVAAVNDNNADETKEEEFWEREQKLKFVVDLTPEFRAGFSFRYQSLESDLLGSHGLSDTDHTRFKATRSGYSLGFFYQLRGMGIGLFTAPSLRGKAVIVSEQKIITEPGQDGLEFIFDATDRLTFKLAALQWTYKHDDRDDLATSPEDQRGIFLRGLDIDQYFRPTKAVALGAEYAFSPMVAAKISLVRRDGVFLFDTTLLPGKDPDIETPLTYNEFRAGLGLRNKEFMAELMLARSSRSADRIRVRRGEVNVNTLGSYEYSATSVLLSLGGAL